MSIVTLKRKTQTQYNNMSVGVNQFSLNGTHRSQGYVGQTSLSRSLPRTLMRGNVARGYGGYYGSFNITPIVQSAVTSLNDPTIVKSSVLSQKGMLNKKYECCFHLVKPDSNQNINDQGSFITNQTKKAIQCLPYRKNLELPTTCCESYNPFFRRIIYNYTKSPSYHTPLTSGEYIQQLINTCVNNDIVYIPNPSTRSLPIGCKNVD
jgi:hypothetical protein